MRITVEYYARLRELAGCPSEVVTMNAGASVKDVWRQATALHGALASMTGRVSAAVNAEFAGMHTVLHDGDEVAFLPPVSGGADTTR
jgi:molybdopterin converting factor subunit 1